MREEEKKEEKRGKAWKKWKYSREIGFSHVIRP
jgi:hypothetical protein